MSNRFLLEWKPWAPIQASNLGPVHELEYGRYLEELRPGQVFWHPRAITFHAGMSQDFAGTFMESCPLYLSREAAKAAGYEDQLVPPLLVLSTALSLGVQNDSEKAIAHLGYYDVCFPKAMLVGETLRSATRVVSVHARAATGDGIVLVETIGVNARGEVTVRYQRKILIPRAPAGRKVRVASGSSAPFQWPARVSVSIPKSSEPSDESPFLPASGACFEDFAEGEILCHGSGRTVTDEHIAWTYRIGNTHPLHFDRIYSHKLPPPMGGEPVVFGGFVFAWVAGLASRDTTANLVWDLGYTEGYHTQPVRSGDTLYGISRVLKKDEKNAIAGTGILQLQLIGLKNLPPREALERFGEELFVKENDKKKSGSLKIAEKVFEIQRRVLLRKR